MNFNNNLQDFARCSWDGEGKSGGGREGGARNRVHDSSMRGRRKLYENAGSTVYRTVVLYCTVLRVLLPRTHKSCKSPATYLIIIITIALSLSSHYPRGIQHQESQKKKGARALAFLSATGARKPAACFRTSHPCPQMAQCCFGNGLKRLTSLLTAHCLI